MILHNYIFFNPVPNNLNVSSNSSFAGMLSYMHLFVLWNTVGLLRWTTTALQQITEFIVSSLVVQQVAWWCRSHKWRCSSPEEKQDVAW